jgi:hypothetical protein
MNSQSVGQLGVVLGRTWPLVAMLIGCATFTAFCRDASGEDGRPVVFVTNYLERGSLATEPRKKQVTDAVRVFASPGEYEPATFSIRSSVELKGVRVELASDLKGRGGSAIPKAAVEVRLVDPFKEWTKKDIECFLLKKDTVDIAASTTRRFWVTVHVPDDAKPGVYRSKIVIGKPITELGPDLGRLETLAGLTYEVEVLDIRLLSAQETGMAFFMYYNTAYFAGRPDGAEKFITDAYQRRVFEDMRGHGMTTATVYLYPVVDGKFTLTGHTKNHLGFIPTMETLKEAKLVTPGLPVIWLGAESYGPDVWKGVLDEGRKKKWPEIVFYAVDEPGEEKRNKQVRAFMKGFNAFRSKYPQYGLRVTTALGSSPGIHKVGHYYDLWIGHTLLALDGVGGEWAKERNWDTDMISEAKRLKKELWVYDCSLSPVHAEMNRYYFGIWAWTAGVKGCSHWAYFAQPYLSYAYPTEDELVPTIGWESVREGIDDYRYLATLKRLADKARAAGKKQAARQADEILEQVKQMVTMGNYSKVFCEAKKSSDKDAWSWNRPRPEPDLAIEAYDQMRSKVAGGIADVERAMKGPK